MSPFFELLQITLGNRREFSAVPTAKDWLIILDEAQRHTIVGLLLDGIEQLPVEQRPPTEILLQWIGQTQLTGQQNRMLNAAAVHLDCIFKDKGLRSCVLKGTGLARLYPNPLRRQSGDVDIWVEGGRDRILQFLKDNNFKVGHVVIHHADSEIIDGVETEIHFMPIWLYQPWHNMSLQRRFNAQSDLQFANYDKELGYCHPTVDFDAVYNLIHVFHHLLEEGIGLRHIIDYYYIINALKDENDKIIVIEAIKSIGLYRFLQAMMWVLKKSCNATDEMLLCEPDEKEGQFLLREILNSGNFGYYQKEKGMRRNSVKRYWTMAKHYPSEVLWMVPWKVWHKLWRIANQY